MRGRRKLMAQNAKVDAAMNLLLGVIREYFAEVYVWEELQHSLESVETCLTHVPRLKDFLAHFTTASLTRSDCQRFWKHVDQFTSRPS
jgi:hypothetical protein